MTTRPFTCLALLLTPLICAAQNADPRSDYPTIERVLFVEACVREHPERQRTEMLYKCSCAMDVIAGALDYGEYVEASTAFFASQAAGERGTAVRESSAGKTLSQRYRDARGTAVKRCMIE